MSEDKEKKYRRISGVTSVAVQLVLLLLFYFLIAWKEPNPPIPSYGIELAFGLENIGAGDRPVTSPEPEEAVQLEESSNESEEGVEDEVTDVAESEPVVEDQVDDLIDETISEQVSEQPSPDVVEEPEKVVEQPQPKKDEVKEAEKKTTPKPETEQSKKTEVDQEALMPKAEKGESNTSSGETSKEGQQGKKEGTIDGRALMGDQGSSTGASLNMAGWAWDQKPQPKDDSSEEGKIVFKIKVDQDGYLVGIDKVFSNVSPTVELNYKQSVERLTFTPTSGSAPAPISEGIITFIIRTK